jgi:hypothetical protein
MKQISVSTDSDLYNFLKQIIVAVVVFVSRFLKLAPNFSPLGSFGFFQKNVVLFFGQIIIFDWFFSGLYRGFIFTYLGFASYYVLGRLAQNKLKKQIVFLPLASLLFFLLSNFGVWLYWYPSTWSGLLACYLAALPFYRNTLLGDICFGGTTILLNLLSKNLKSCYKLNQFHKNVINNN